MVMLCCLGNNIMEKCLFSVDVIFNGWFPFMFGWIYGNWTHECRKQQYNALVHTGGHRGYLLCNSVQLTLIVIWSSHTKQKLIALPPSAGVTPSCASYSVRYADVIMGLQTSTVLPLKKWTRPPSNHGGLSLPTPSPPSHLQYHAMSTKWFSPWKFLCYLSESHFVNPVPCDRWSSVLAILPLGHMPFCLRL